MNFCRFYNRLMKKLKDKHQPVSSISIVTGILNMIGVVCISLLEKIFYPFIKIGKYLNNHIHFIMGEVDIFSRGIYLVGVTSFGFVSWILISLSIYINYLIVWIILLPFIYVTAMLAISCFVGIFSKNKADYIFVNFVVLPIMYLHDKTISRCDLSNE